MEGRNFEERNFGEEEEIWRRGILEERNFQGNEFIYWGILEKRNFGGEEFWKGGILRRGTLKRKRNFVGEEY